MNEKLYSFTSPLTQQQLEEAFEHYKSIAPDLFLNINPSFRVSSRLVRAFGSYNHQNNIITLSATAHVGDLEDINRTLLHELAHVRQFQLYKSTGDSKYLDLKPQKRNPKYSKYHGKYFFAIASEFEKVFGVNIEKNGAVNKRSKEVHLEQDDYCQLIFLLKFHSDNKHSPHAGLLKMQNMPEDIEAICKKIHKQYFGAIASVDVYKMSRHYHLKGVKQVLKDGTLKSPLSAIPIYLDTVLSNATKELVHSTSFDQLPHGLRDKHIFALQAADSRRKKTFCDFAQQISRAMNGYGEEVDFIANPAFLGTAYPTLLQAAFASWQATPLSELSRKHGHISSVAHNLYLVGSHISEIINPENKEELQQNFMDRLHNAYLTHCYPRHAFADYKSAVIKQLKKWRHTETAIELVARSVFTAPGTEKNHLQTVRQIALEEMSQDAVLIPLGSGFNATPSSSPDIHLEDSENCLQMDMF